MLNVHTQVLCLKATKRASTDDSPYFNTRDKFVNVLDMHNLSLSIFWDKRITEGTASCRDGKKVHFASRGWPFVFSATVSSC